MAERVRACSAVPEDSSSGPCTHTQLSLQPQASANGASMCTCPHTTQTFKIITVLGYFCSRNCSGRPMCSHNHSVSLGLYSFYRKRDTVSSGQNLSPLLSNFRSGPLPHTQNRVLFVTVSQKFERWVPSQHWEVGGESWVMDF